MFYYSKFIYREKQREFEKAARIEEEGKKNLSDQIKNLKNKWGLSVEREKSLAQDILNLKDHFHKLNQDQLSILANAFLPALQKIAAGSEKIKLLDLRILANSGNPDVLLAVSQSPILHKSPLVRISLARNESLPKSVFPKLSKDPDPRVLLKLVKNRKATKNTYFEVAKNKNANPETLVFIVKKSILNENQTLKALLRIVNHPKVTRDELYFAAKHKNSKENVLKIILSNKKADVDVKIAAANNINASEKISKQIFAELAGDKSVAVNLMAVEISNINIDWKKFFKDKNIEFRVKSAKNLKASIIALIYLSNDVNDRVRIAIAEHPNTPKPDAKRILKKLALSHKLEMRVRVASNIITPPKSLYILSKDISIVKNAAAKTLKKIKAKPKVPKKPILVAER